MPIREAPHGYCLRDLEKKTSKEKRSKERPETVTVGDTPQRYYQDMGEIVQIVERVGFRFHTALPRMYWGIERDKQFIVFTQDGQDGNGPDFLCKRSRAIRTFPRLESAVQAARKDTGYLDW